MGNYSRSKIKWNKNEQEALNDVCKLQNTKPELLKAMHTENSFVWTTILDKSSSKEVEEEGVYKVNKIDFETENEAIESAMYNLDTFEGNLQRNDTELQYVFSKVRE